VGDRFGRRAPRAGDAVRASNHLPVRRPDAPWRHTTNYKIATETRAICWLEASSNPARDKLITRARRCRKKATRSVVFCQLAIIFRKTSEDATHGRRPNASRPRLFDGMAQVAYGGASRRAVGPAAEGRITVGSGATRTWPSPAAGTASPLGTCGSRGANCPVYRKTVKNAENKGEGGK
jgi:hypothetical protein